MSNRLEQFIHDHREEFDSEVPNPMVWNKLQQQIAPTSSKVKLRTFVIVRWTAAAAILVLAGVGIFHLLNTGKQAADPVVQYTTDTPAGDALLNDINPAYAKEVYHFTQLIELKQTELKQLAKDNPGLYKTFISDITKLDSSYNALKKELPANPNREQLLEAMIENLRLQTGLLNQQLEIIQQIKKAKEKSHENNSKPA